jgi:O-antigen/teichoic acid export membrane protein
MKRLQDSALFIATLSEMLLPFARNVALARILPADQFGLGVSLSVVYGIAEQTTDIGLNFSAVRTNGRSDPDRLYATLHCLLVLRGTLIGVLICATAPLIAMAFGAPDAAWAYMTLGFAMFVRGFANLGVREAMRNYEFWREALTVLGSQSFWTVATTVLALITLDLRAVILGTLCYVVSYVVLSHALSPRRWSIGWDRATAEEVLAYGRPLILNGMSNAFIQLADRFVVGTVLGVVQLGVYNVAMVTALLPRNTIAKALITVIMPAFVNLGDEKSRTIRLFDAWVLCIALLGFGYGVALLSVGPVLIEAIFGSRFRPTDFVMGLIAINITAKFLDQVPVPASLAFGHTGFIFFGTIASAMGVAVSVVALLIWRDFDIFILALALGQVAALTWIIVRTIRFHRQSPPLTLFLVYLPLLVETLLVVAIMESDWSLATRIAVTWTAALVTVLVMIGAAVTSGLNLATLVPLIREARAKPHEAPVTPNDATE